MTSQREGALQNYLMKRIESMQYTYCRLRITGTWKGTLKDKIQNKVGLEISVQ